MSKRFRLAPLLVAATVAACSQSGPQPTSAKGAVVPQAAIAQPTSAPVVTVPRVSPDQVPRTAPAEAHRLVQAGQALLVCAYDDDDRYQRNKLEGSISFGEFQRRLPSLGKDQEIILYCS